MKKNILSISILISGILISGAIIGFANAQTEPLLQPQEQKMPGDIQYPIPELGNCKSKSDCKTFCDNSKNSDACLAFAEKRNLMSPEEIANAKKFKDNGMVGPGGCKGQAACDAYCGNSIHLEECTIFAQKNGMMSEEELQNSQKVLTAIKNGIKPPACSGPKQCNTYCSNPKHMEECMTFSIAAGIIPDNQKEQMQKTLDAIKQGVKPPACQPNPPPGQSAQTESSQSEQGLPSCDTYCGTHMEECMTFSLATGMVPDNQKEQMQKTLNVLKQGIKPPACQPNPPSQSGEPNQPGQPNQQNKNQPNKSSQSGEGLQACDQYCAEPSHVEECVKFSVAMGNMTEQQAQSSIKNGNKGPGGCIGKDACDTFCNNPDNEETCFNFAKDSGMIPEGDLQKMQEGQQKMKDSFSQIPPEVLDCLTSTVGADVVEKMKTGSVIGRKFGDSINQCFQKSGVEERRPDQNQNGQDQQNQTDQQGQPGDKFQPGPGNVNTGGQQMPQQAGPGGCKGPEECQKYCESNPEVCKNFQPQPNQMQPGEPGNPGQMKPGDKFVPPKQPDQNKIEPGEQGQMMQPNQPGRFIQGEPGEPGKFIQNQINQLNQPNQLNPINQPGGEAGRVIQGQPGQMEPQQQMQPQSEPQPLQQPQTPPPTSSPSGFFQGTQDFLANVLSVFK